MIRFIATAVAGLFAASTAGAQAPSGYYVAVPAAQASKANLITRSTPWTLRDGAYVANRAPERDAVLCELVAKNVGRLDSFSVAGKPFDADALAKCNSHSHRVATETAAR